jgi:hypothetical protein
VTSKLITKLRTLGLNTCLCNWILDFLTGRPQVVRVGNNTSATLILNPWAPQRYELSPLMYSLVTHDCTAKHGSNIIKLLVGLITDNDETAFWEEVRDLVVWCQDNNLSLNVIKTKEMIVDYRKRRTEHIPILIDGAILEQVESFKFQQTNMVQAHQDSREEGTTKPIPFQETEKIWHGSSKGFTAAPSRAS